jgi:Fur family ferric uptake transcriptional regulator
MQRPDQACHERGLRNTAHRRLVLEVLDAAADHPCAAEIHRRVAQHQPLSLATTYRILNRLTEAGVLRRLSFGYEKARYELASRRHHHLIDRNTGRVVEIHDDSFTALLEHAVLKLGYRLIDYRLEFTGDVEPATRP